MIVSCVAFALLARVEYESRAERRPATGGLRAVLCRLKSSGVAHAR
jgi:hypothetical protein